MTRFGKYCRSLLTGSLVFGGMLAVTVLGASLSASPAAAEVAPAWTAYVVASNDNAVIPVNTATDSVGTPIAAGSAPSAIAITPDAATAYVTDEGLSSTSTGTVTPIDLLTNTEGAAINVGSGPDAIGITPNGLSAYVGNYNDDTVTPINLVTNTPGTPIAVGAPPTAITVSPDGSTAYVTLGGDAYDVPITVATNTAGSPILNTNDGFASAITPDGSTLFTPNFTYNGVATLDTATDARGSIAALDDPEGIAITPDGSSAYVAYTNFSNNQASLLPIDTATDSAGTSIALGTSSAEGVAITPDGSTAFVTDPVGGTVVPVDLALGTAGSPISLGSGSDPVAVAITPDQAPIAHLTSSRPTGDTTVLFDASASTVAYGTIASYSWNFGDGTTETTTTPTTTHAYSPDISGAVAASLTETSSAGTSTTEVFTGQTASANGGSQASTMETPFKGTVPTVTSVTPDLGSTYGPTTVTLTGIFVDSGTPGGTEVYVGGILATNVSVNLSDTAITAVLPAQSAGVDNIIVSIVSGDGAIESGAATPSNQFTYSASTPVVYASCQSSECSIPSLQYGDTSVSSTVSSNCDPCTYSASAVEGVPGTGTAQGGCPAGMSYEQTQTTVGETDPNNGGSFSVFTEDSGFNETPTVCETAEAISSGPATGAPRIGHNASPAAKYGKDILLKACARSAVAPCVKRVVVKGSSVMTTVILPVNESITLTVGPQKETIKKLSPTTGAPGSKLTITGTNLTQVNAVFIDGDRSGGQLIGGVQASIVSRTADKLVVKVPLGVSTGKITLIGWSGDVTSSSKFKVS